MANTFKLVTKANVTSLDVIYTVAASTTTVVLGLMLGNTTGAATTATVTLGSDTAGRSGNNDEANQTVELVTSVPVLGNATLELLAGNKIILEATDTLSVSAGASTDVTLSIMEIT
jgi:hypothetical protein